VVLLSQKIFFTLQISLKKAKCRVPPKTAGKIFGKSHLREGTNFKTEHGFIRCVFSNSDQSIYGR
jgi:hypothetical protein